MSQIDIKPLKPVRPLSFVLTSPHWSLLDGISQPFHKITQQDQHAWIVEMLTWPGMKFTQQLSSQAFRSRVEYFASYWQVMDFCWDLDDKTGIHFAYGRLTDHLGVIHSISFFMEVK